MAGQYVVLVFIVISGFVITLLVIERTRTLRRAPPAPLHVAFSAIRSHVHHWILHFGIYAAGSEQRPA
jgi:divalent metal cation (Fe/Co/Zn/Cd) transporter